ncbi:unnamed protein product [Prorocentrum cordatum]|uniref:Uncharacterized protein n=1 Tax=Prorocentrum cordatum TaxID=2364126 RepID=A0ABN9WPE6_9DINO|nr:unnamed protein product [Polarella glacialis]
MSDDDALFGGQLEQYEADRSRRIALERELQELEDESERGRQVLDSLDEKIRTLREEAGVRRRRLRRRRRRPRRRSGGTADVEQQRLLKPERGCSACRAVTLQVDAAAQSLLGSAGHVARTLLRDPDADRAELLDTVLRYLEPVKHLDPDLEELYGRAQARLACLSLPPDSADGSDLVWDGATWIAVVGDELITGREVHRDPVVRDGDLQGRSSCRIA